jgi:hypothetical protein
MIRLVVPLLVLSAGIWSIVFYLHTRPKVEQRAAKSSLKQLLVSLGLSVALLLLISAFFYILELAQR